MSYKLLFLVHWYLVAGGVVEFLISSIQFACAITKIKFTNTSLNLSDIQRELRHKYKNRTIKIFII